MRIGAPALLYRLVAVNVPVGAVGAQTVPVSGATVFRSVTPSPTSAPRGAIGGCSGVPMVSVAVQKWEPVVGTAPRLETQLAPLAWERVPAAALLLAFSV